MLARSPPLARHWVRAFIQLMLAAKYVYVYVYVDAVAAQVMVATNPVP
jgi:hypothetical protein